LTPTYHTCHVGLDHFFIQPNGDVDLCNYMSSVGNVVTSRPWEVWQAMEAEQRRAAITDCRKTCLSACIYKRDLKETGELFLKVFIGNNAGRQRAGAAGAAAS
jgi:radical SAM protein with 4Fe4S-binding SPASM domain